MLEIRECCSKSLRLSSDSLGYGRPQELTLIWPLFGRSEPAKSSQHEARNRGAQRVLDLEAVGNTCRDDDPIDESAFPCAAEEHIPPQVCPAVVWNIAASVPATARRR